MDTGSEHKVKGLIEDLSISKNADGNYDVMFRIAGTEITGVLHAATYLETVIESKYGRTWAGWPYLNEVTLGMQLAGTLVPAPADESERIAEGDYWTMTRKARDCVDGV